MSSNIVTSILNMLAPALLDKIAAALGVSSGTAKAAAATAAAKAPVVQAAPAQPPASQAS